MNPSPPLNELFANATRWLAEGDYVRAEPGFRAILEHDPAHRPSCNNLAACLFGLGRHAEALHLFGRLAGNSPEDAMAHYNAGRCLRELGDMEQAARAYRQAISLRPDYREARENLANLLADLGRPDEALPLYELGMAADPERADNYRQAALQLRERGQPGDLERARQVLDQAIGREVSGADALRLVRSLLMPPIAGSRAEIDSLRSDLERSLARFESAPLKIADPLAEVGMVPFFLAYHGEDDRQLNERLARVLRHASPGLRFEKARRMAARRARPRIGVVTAHAGPHTVSRYFTSSIRALERHADVRTYYVGQEWRSQFDGASLPARGQLPADLAASRVALAEEDLDVLIYPEIGIHPQPWFLAHARLAPVQIALYGQPVTTGIPTIDFFVSHAGSEPPGASAHYTESLLMLPEQVSPACMEARHFDVPRRTRADFGLPEGRHLYLCAQSLFKVHPDFDALAAQLLHADPEAELLLFATRGHWGERALARIQGAASHADHGGRSRIRMLPFLPLPEFMALAACCDVALDTPQYSGGATSYDCLQAGLPIVSWPGRFMRARQTTALYRHMGIDELVVSDAGAYVAVAQRVASDRREQRRLRDEIVSRLPRLFDDRASADAFCEIVSGARTP